METATLNVPTVHCRACKLNIEESLEDVGGVSDSSVDVDAKQVSVTFDPAVVDQAAISAAIVAAGYPVG
ncbi:MAG: heavy-metal-associated domain-containing protein [Ilumatobacteraceae bacterium]